MSVLRIEHVTKEFKLTLRQRQKQKTKKIKETDLIFDKLLWVKQ